MELREHSMQFSPSQSLANEKEITQSEESIRGNLKSLCLLLFQQLCIFKEQFVQYEALV